VQKAEFMDTTQLSLPVVLRRGGPGDEHLLADLLGSLSPTSSFHRFMAGVGAANSPLVRGLLRTDACHGALFALPADGAGARALAHACWAVGSTGAADVAVVVADDAQGQGLGTVLFAAAVRIAALAGATTLHLDVHPENRRLAAALRRRLGPGSLAWQDGVLSVDAPMADVIGASWPVAAMPAA
jgi:GNAT superfamily N-acetyltransferase